MRAFLNSLSVAATHPYAFAAYAIAALLFLFAGAKLQMARLLLARIDSLPEADRRRALELATGTILPAQISAEKWIRHERQKWIFLLIGAALIAVIAVATIALVNPTAEQLVKKMEDAVSQGTAHTVSTVTSESSVVQVGLWRDRYGFGEISGGAWIVIPLHEDQSALELEHWLARVQARYLALRAAHGDIDTEWLSSDGLKGDDYLEINSGTTPKQHWDLIPQGEKEAFVDELLFNSRYFLLATSGNKGGLLLSPLSFTAAASSVKIFFDPSTRRATRIEGLAHGVGQFHPVPGQFTNWLDFYGAKLIVRQKISNPVPEAFALVEYKSITFQSRGTHWSPTATFAEHTGAELYTDNQRSLIVQNADWRTLGEVPSDYPGERLASYGEKPKLW